MVLSNLNCKCKFAQKNISIKIKQADRFLINYMLKQILDQLGQQQLKKLYQEHGEEAISYCLTEGFVMFF